jgi:hypothetical protein
MNTDGLLVNAGIKFGPFKAEDYTVPAWMLPGVPGQRGFPDKPDMMLVMGWKRGDAPPADKSAITLIPLEHCYSNDFFMADSRLVKQAKYARLMYELRAHGWLVVGDASETPTFFADHKGGLRDHEDGEIPPAVISTFVQGHMGSMCRRDLDTLAAFGVQNAKLFLKSLYKLAVVSMHKCVSTYIHAVRGVG